MAHLYDVSTNRSYRRLRSTSGFNQFPFVRDGKSRTVAAGAIVKVEDRELIFRPEISAEDGDGNR